MRTSEEIQQQIEGLQDLKASLPEFSFFGTANWEIIDMQISILNRTVSFAELEPDEYLLDEEGVDEVYNAAEDAQYWLAGESDDNLYE